MKPIGIVIGAPFESSARELTGISGLDVVAGVIDVRSAVIEYGVAPRNRLDLVAIGELSCDIPVPPSQVGKEVVALFIVHAGRHAVVGCGSIKFGKEQRTFSTVIEY